MEDNLVKILLYKRKNFLVYRMVDKDVDTYDDSYGIFRDGILLVELETKDDAINMVDYLIRKEE